MDPSGSKSIALSSFLAGILLVKKNATSFELIKCMDDFSNKYDCYLDEPVDDFKKLIDIVYFDGKVIYLTENTALIHNYLYNLTTKEVREYFGIEEREDIKAYETKSVKKKSIIDMIKRTKIYVRP